jgi:hypothetical protein
MTIAHVDTVRTAIGEQKVLVLADIFKNCKGTPPQVHAARYRADHPQWLNTIDELANTQTFLQRDRNGANYRLSVYALPIIEDVHADALLRLMDTIYIELKKLYHVHLSDMIPLPEIIATISGDPSDIREALYYLTVDSSGVYSGLSNNFPYSDDPKMGISESVLRHPDFGSVLSEFYEWNFVNPQSRASAWETSQLHSASAKVPGFFTADDASTRPSWYEQLDAPTKALISELDEAISTGLAALPTMGLRTLIESVMRDHVGEKDSFKEYLKAFRKAGYVTDQHAELIEKVVNAGHASVHRAYFPNPSDLRICIEVVKHLLQGVYVLKPKVDVVTENTPKRTTKDAGGKKDSSD